MERKILYRQLTVLLKKFSSSNTLDFALRADVNVAVNMEKMVIPSRIQIIANILAINDFGALSPYLIVNKL